MRIIAHRGASAEAPENTLGALRRALERGSAGAEIDVRLAADGTVVLLHDATLGRTTDQRGRLRTCPAERLRAADAGRWFGPAWAGERVPALAELLQEWPAGRRLFIELKDGVESLAPLRAALAPWRHLDLHLLAFDAKVLRAAGTECPGWPRHHNVEAPRWGHARWLRRQVDEARAEGWAGLSFGVDAGWGADWPAGVHEAGLNCAVWTVDDLARARRLAGDGVDDLMTNDPAGLIGAGR